MTRIIILGTIFILAILPAWGQIMKSDKYDTETLFVCGADSVYIVSVRNGNSIKYGMLNADKQPLLGLRYDEIRIFGTNLFTVALEQKYGIYDAKGNQILPIEYTLPIRYLAQSYYRVGKDGKYGIFDRMSQKMIFPADYFSINYYDSEITPILEIGSVIKSLPSSEYITAVAVRDSADVRCEELLDLTNQKVLIPCGLYDEIRPSDHSGCVYLRRGNDWKIISYKGHEYLSSKEYHDAEITPFGFITQNENGLKGFVPLEGDIVKPAYLQIAFANNGIARVIDLKNKEGALRKDGKLILPPKYNFIDIHATHVTFGFKDKMGVATFDGEVIFKMDKYENIEYFPEDGVAVVKKEERSGLIDKKGNVLIPLNYRDVYFESKSKVARMTDFEYKCGMYNVKTKKHVPPKYDGLGKFIDGISVIGYFSEQGNKYGLLDEAGNEVVVPTYETMFFDERQQYATVTLNRKHGMIDGKGNIVVSVEYDKFKEYKPENDKNGIAIVCLMSKFGAFNYRDNIELLPAIYDEIVDFGFYGREGTKGLRYFRDNKYGFIDYDGKTILPHEYDYIETVQDRLKLKKDGKYGISTFDGQLLIPFLYDNLESASATGHKADIIAQKGKKYGIINMQGDVLVPFEFDCLRYSYNLKNYIAQRGERIGFFDRVTHKIYMDEERQADIKAELERN